MSKSRSRLFLLFLATVCALPLVLSYVTYYVWKPERRMNYGELLPMKQLPPAQFAMLEGKPLPEDDIHGKWLLLQVDTASCGEDCRRRLFAMRQVRLAMGVKKDKLEAVWLVDGEQAPSGALLTDYQSVRVVRAAPAFVAALPAPAGARIFLIDPDRNLVLRYPEAPDPARMIRDLARLLDVKRL